MRSIYRNVDPKESPGFLPRFAEYPESCLQMLLDSQEKVVSSQAKHENPPATARAYYDSRTRNILRLYN
jgi:hypothetical protein